MTGSCRHYCLLAALVVAAPGHAAADEQLQQFLNENKDEFRKPTVLSFRHIYFSPDRRGDSAAEDARDALTNLTPDADSAAVAAMGDPIFLQREFDMSDESDIARALGEDFVPKLLALDPHQWHGPLRSGFGYHLVQVTKHIKGRIPMLHEIREAVLARWQVSERQRYTQEFYGELREKYDVTVTMPQSLTATGESAVRDDG